MAGLGRSRRARAGVCPRLGISPGRARPRSLAKNPERQGVREGLEAIKKAGHPREGWPAGVLLLALAVQKEVDRVESDVKALLVTGDLVF